MKISQREARRLRKRVDELEELEAQRRSRWSAERPGGTHFWTMPLTVDSRAAIKTARTLGHAVVATLNDAGELRLHALPEAPRAD